MSVPSGRVGGVRGLCGQDGPDEGVERPVGGDGAVGGVVGPAVDPERGEHGGVEELAGLVADTGIEPLSMAEQFDDLLESGEDLVGGGLGVLDESFRVGDLGRDLVLPLFQDLDRQCVGHVGIEQLLSVAFEFGQTTSLVDQEPRTGLSAAVEVVTCPRAELGDLLFGESHGSPRSGGGVLDVGYGEIWGLLHG